jgi:hypothetical protein
LYVRFSVASRDDVSGIGMGLFTAMGILRDKDVLVEYEIELYENTLRWFAKNLAVPRVLGGSNFHNRPTAVSWFKDTAVEHIGRMRQLGQILESHDIAVTQFSTDRPGKVQYEDQYQIAAIPFRDTFVPAA